MERKGWKVAGIFSPKTFASYITNPSKDLLLISPIVGLNSYDKLMVGAAITNYKLPSSPFQFLLMPMYSTGAKKMAGLGKLNYSFFPKTTFRKIDLFFNASKFSYNEFIKDNGGKVYSGYQKLVPGIRLTMNEKNQRSNMNRYIQWKSFVIREEAFRVSYDSIFTGLDTIINQSVNIKTENRTLQQLKIVFENSRVLYPYSAELKIEKGKDFVKTSFAGNYFFNYPKKGGFDLRFFAGKFFYLNNPGYIAKYRSDRYKLKLTSVSGAEDYTYSDYFIGRNRYDGAASQQMMIRDGGLKLRLDQFEGDPDFSKRIRSDNLLFSLNMVTTMPAGILPSFIPLKLFADIGSTSAMWKKENSYGKFVYVAGLQLSFFKNTINVYAPLLYSKEFKNLLLSDPVNKKFTKRISFSIDIANFSLKKISRELDF